VPLKPGATVTQRVVRRRAAAAEASTARVPAAAQAEPPPLSALHSRVLLSSDSFDPLAYLTTVHRSSTLPELQQGLAHLQEDAAARRSAIATLVKENFERFISCKSTIDDVLATLRRAEGVPGGAAAGSSKRGQPKAAPQASQTQQMMQAVKAVQAEAHKVLGPLLERQAQSDSVRTVLSLLRRHRALFALPARLRAAAERGDGHSALREWRAARAIVGPTEAPVMHRLLAVAEREVNALERGLRWVLAAPGSGVEAAEYSARMLLEIQAVRSGAADADPSGASAGSHAASARSPAADCFARELVLSFVAGRCGGLERQVASDVAALHGALQERERKAARRHAAAMAAMDGAHDAAADADAQQVPPRTPARSSSLATLEAALLAAHGDAAGEAVAAASRAASASASRAAAEAAAEQRGRFVRGACAAAARTLPDTWRFAQLLTPAGAAAAAAAVVTSAGGHRRAASASSVLDAFSQRAGFSPCAARLDPACDAALRRCCEALCAGVRAVLVPLADAGGAAAEGHLRAALAEVAALGRILSDTGAPASVSAPVEELRCWGVKRLVADLVARLQADTAAAAASQDDAPAPPAHLAATSALLSLGGAHAPADEQDLAAAPEDAARELRVSSRPLAFCAALARAMSLLLGVAAEGGAVASACVCGDSFPAFFASFHAFADALATRAEHARIVGRDGAPPQPLAGGEEDSAWEGAAMALLADSAFVRLWVLPALTHRFHIAWSSGGGACDVDGERAGCEDTLGALEEHVLEGYTARHGACLEASCRAYFDGDGTDWARAPAPRGVRDAAIALLDWLAGAHAQAHARAGPFTDGVVAALACKLLSQLAACARGSVELKKGLSSHGFATLALERAFFSHALQSFGCDDNQASLGELDAAEMDAAVATAKQAAAATGRSGFSRTAARAALRACGDEAVAALLPGEVQRTALHTACFRHHAITQAAARLSEERMQAPPAMEAAAARGAAEAGSAEQGGEEAQQERRRMKKSSRRRLEAAEDAE